LRKRAWSDYFKRAGIEISYGPAFLTGRIKKEDWGVPLIVDGKLEDVAKETGCLISLAVKSDYLTPMSDISQPIIMDCYEV
jgi:hypothetical protein